MPTSSVAEAVATLAAGGKVLVIDDEDRENEGDLITAAEHATTDEVALSPGHTSGFLCVSLDERRAREPELDLMVTADAESHGTAFLVSVDLRHGTSTGISAGDRAATIRALADPGPAPSDLARPGHGCRCAPGPAGCWNAPGTPRPASTCAARPGSAARRCCARSSPRTGAR
ncbi:3,4-dihydroxy-2-butanone-4-phosphate synthase [Saccharopolyspora sp. NFXS83]|uniref:3,4-dihydroxy-2-butanone-4-phosphate synthase n=1 Tax=Saccharopolyspora sp. NFXS83 TaxID=2993560 RepID=UPI00224B9B23|nr:3,4-dihydroxy-2-butanone-4-phosphate synthase [Saccharopolyspora sp. NFXS83]MCX2729216.1 3,4-dihydroxy-2-butanone-4-phosphate synthase [Saccharopolyspora sp. NFXS83]